MKPTRVAMIGWLAVLLCIGSTVDRVIDLVFEEPEATAETDVSADAPDNAAEHLLMPSPRAAAPTSAGVPVVHFTDFDMSAVAVLVMDATASRAAPSHHPPPRSRSLSFSIPLRI
ncbi:MAG: hypothetical protein ABL970_04030 [Nitrospira sp.]